MTVNRKTRAVGVGSVVAVLVVAAVIVATLAGTDNHPQIVVYRTSDKGSTWDSTTIATTLDWEKNDIGGVKISFADASNGYLMITGTPGAGQMAKSLYRTTDGGKTFSFAGDITGMTDAAGTLTGVVGYPTGMTFSTPETGFVTCSYHGHTYVLMFETTDGGGTWTLGPASNNPDVRTYSFIDATTGWGLDENGKILTTKDGGAIWAAIAATAK